MFEYWTLIVSIIILIFASGFFSSSETGLTAASDAKMRQLANNGNRNAGISFLWYIMDKFFIAV